MDRYFWDILLARSSAVTITQVLYRSDHTQKDLSLRIFQKFIEVCLLPWETACADHFDKPVIVDQNVTGMHVAYLKMVLLEFRSSSNHAVKKIPKFRLQEKTTNLSSIFYLHLKNIGIVIKGELNDRSYTLTSPEEPQSPVDSYIVLLGSSKTSRVIVSSIFLTYLYQRLNSASDSITLVIVICSCGLPYSSVTYIRTTSPKTECCYMLEACSDDVELPIIIQNL